jgi:hypothetical protein
VSAQSLAGLAVLNLLFLLTGVGIVWALRGWPTWGDVARLAGLSYLVGLVTTGSIWTLLLIFGAPFSLVLLLGVPALLIGSAVVLARRQGRVVPVRGTLPTGPGAVVTGVGIAAAVVLLEGFFRVARLNGLYWWDAWSFWIPKAKSIYFLGEIDAGIFTTFAGPSYPPFVPVLDAAAFRFMGSTDVVTLHVQYWLLGVAFVWALAGLLAERVRAWMLWPFVILLLVAPRIGSRFLVTEADLFLDYLFAIAALLVAAWLVDRERWCLIAATVLMAGMVLTKREGLLFAAVLVVSALLASARQWRFAWPRIVAATLVVAAVALPWRIWYLAHGVSKGEAPPGGGLDPTENTDRLWPSFRLAFDVLFSSDYWSVLVPVFVGALALAVLARVYRLAAFFGAIVLFVTLGGGWITWAITELEISQDLGGNPIVRYIGAAALLCAVASPLLLASAWSAVTSREAGT